MVRKSFFTNQIDLRTVLPLGEIVCVWAVVTMVDNIVEDTVGSVEDVVVWLDDDKVVSEEDPVEELAVVLNVLIRVDPDDKGVVLLSVVGVDEMVARVLSQAGEQAAHMQRGPPKRADSSMHSEYSEQSGMSSQFDGQFNC